MLSTALRSSSLPIQSLKPHSVSCCCFSTHHPLWSGLETWRDASVNHNRFWGPSGPEPEHNPHDQMNAQLGSVNFLAEMGAMVLSTPDPLTKSRLSHIAYSKWRSQNLPIGISEPPHTPARPPKPQLVRSFFSFFKSSLLIFQFRIKSQI